MVRTRQAKRFHRQIPLKITVANSPEWSEVSVATANISSRGVYFWSLLPFAVGQQLTIALRLPAEMAGRAKLERVYHGRVTRIEADELRGTAGVAVEFFYYETLKERPAELKTVKAQFGGIAVGRKKLDRRNWPDPEWEAKKTA